MAILKKLSLIIFCTLLTGCYEDFTPDIDTTPVLCINSLITAGEPINVQVSRTWLYTDREPSVLTDATVSIYANGVLQDESYIPREGDSIKIVAHSDTYGDAEAEVTVPVAVPIGEVTYDTYLNSARIYELTGYVAVGEVYFNLRANLMINDPAIEENYYRFSYTSYCKLQRHPQPDDNPNGSYASPAGFYSGDFREDAEPIFSEHIGVFESIMGGDVYGFTFFTDRSFQGSAYPLHLYYTDCVYRVSAREENDDLFDCGLVLTLTTVSESYYFWANYCWQRDEGTLEDFSNLGFSDPMYGYSNVSTGAGIVAAQSHSTDTLSLKTFIEQVVNNK